MTQQALVLDFGGVISRTLFETHALPEAALGLPPGIMTNAKNILNDPAHSVEVTSYDLRYLYESQPAQPRSRSEALKRYAGYDYDRAAWRLKLIAGWQACERALLSINGRWSDEPEAVLSALAQSRSFGKTDPAVRSALFPG